MLEVYCKETLRRLKGDCRDLLQMRAVGRKRLVLDLSCRKRGDTYYVVRPLRGFQLCTSTSDSRPKVYVMVLPLRPARLLPAMLEVGSTVACYALPIFYLTAAGNAVCASKLVSW